MVLRQRWRASEGFELGWHWGDVERRRLDRPSGGIRTAMGRVSWSVGGGVVDTGAGVVMGVSLRRLRRSDGRRKRSGMVMEPWSDRKPLLMLNVGLLSKVKSNSLAYALPRRSCRDKTK